jgi:RNA polymerase sigma-70 factor, ECF subfamily
VARSGGYHGAAAPGRADDEPAILGTFRAAPDLTNVSEPLDQDAERRFVEAVMRGDREARVGFEMRVRCVTRFLAVLNARRGRPFDEHDLADLAQATIAIAWRKLPAYEPLAQLEVWLHRLCCYEFANALRRRGRERQRSGDVEVDELTGTSQTAHGHDDLHLALARLGGVEADIIVLKHFDGLTFAEISARTGSPENTVKTRYYRGLARLEAMLRGAAGDGEHEP